MADKNFMNIFRRAAGLLAISAKMDLAWLLRDTKYAIAGILADLISNVSTVSGVFLIAVRFGGIGGMSADEVLFMMAYSTLSTGVFILFGSSNNIHISRVIGRGQLEHLFIQPLSLKLQLFTNGFSPFTGGSNFVSGIILMVVATARLSLNVTPLWILSLCMFQLTTLTIIVARSYLISSTAFYAPVAAEEISTTVIDGTWFLSTFPLSGMPKFIQIPLLSILPEGFMAWFPALCLLGRPPLSMLNISMPNLGLNGSYMMLYALLIVAAARYMFKRGLNYYMKKGANRYVPYGFRR